MNDRERARLMDAVLDGEATPAETRNLDRLLASDSTARDQFEQLKKVFEALRGMPAAFPPEGMVAAILANIPQNRSAQVPGDQLSSRSRVIGTDTKEVRGTIPGKSIKGPPVHQPVPSLREWNMNEASSSSRRRNVLIGGSIAIAAALLAVAYTTDFPPGAQNVVGTIVPAQRFKAAQPVMDDLKAGAQAGSQAVPLQAGSAANAATNNAVSAGTTNGITAGTTNAIVQGTTNAVNAGTTNAINAGTANATTNATVGRPGRGDAITDATTNAVSNGTTNAINAGTTNATANAMVGRPGRGDAMTNATMNATTNGTTNAVSNGTTNAVSNGTTNAVSQGTTNAVSQGSTNAINSSTTNAINQSTTNAINGSQTNNAIK